MSLLPHAQESAGTHSMPALPGLGGRKFEAEERKERRGPAASTRRKGTREVPKPNQSCQEGGLKAEEDPRLHFHVRTVELVRGRMTELPKMIT